MKTPLRLIFVAGGMVGVMLAVYVGLTVGSSATRIASQRKQSDTPPTVTIVDESNQSSVAGSKPPVAESRPLVGERDSPVTKASEEVGVSFASDLPNDTPTVRLANVNVKGSSGGIQRLPHAALDATRR